MSQELFSALHQTYNNKYFDDVRALDVPEFTRYTVPLKSGDDSGPEDDDDQNRESGRMKGKTKSLHDLSSSTGRIGSPKPHHRGLATEKSVHNNRTGALPTTKSPYGSLGNLTTADLKRPGSHLSLHRETTRSPSPDLGTILDRALERSLLTTINKTESNLYQSTDNLVKARLTQAHGSLGNLTAGAGAKGDEYTGRRIDSASARGSSSNLRSKRFSSSSTNLSFSTKPSSKSKSSVTTLPAITPTHKTRNASTTDLDIHSLGTTTLLAAQEAIAQGEARRIKQKGVSNSSSSLNSTSPSTSTSTSTRNSISNLNSSSRSTSITDITSRLTNPTNYPTTYKQKYDAIKQHQERVLSEAISSRNVNEEGLSKKAEEVVKRLTDPKNSTKTHLQKSKSTSLTSLDPTASSSSLAAKPKTHTKQNPKIEFFTDFAGPPPEPTHNLSARNSTTNLAGSRSNRGPVDRAGLL